MSAPLESPPVAPTAHQDAAPRRRQGPAVHGGAGALALFAVTLSAVSLAQVWSLPWPLAVALGLGGLALWGWTQRGAQAAHAGQAAQTTQPAQPARAAQAPADPMPAAPAVGEGLPAAAPAGGAALQASAPTPSESESFAYTVSHDLRAPIRVIEGFTRIVREDYGHLLDRVGNDHLDRVLGAAARMNHMIDALLALARLSSQPLARQRVDLSRLAQHVLDDLCKHTPQRRIEWRVMPELSTQGDPTLLRLVLENLLGNAWKYSARRDVAQIEFGCAPQGDRQVYFISDNGAGFDMRFADRLFGPFQRLHSAAEFQGTGVGLASVQRIVRRHGGEIWAEAEVDRGATFYFTLG